MSRRPLLLLSNDDGFRAQGLNVLRTALLPHADVVVCAPETEQSASSHSLSLHRPLRLSEHGAGVFSVDGTPADCVYTAFYAGTRILPRRPDLVLSGLNHGANLGDDVFYSGTVAAAREGALRGVPALALSAGLDADRAAAAAEAARIALALFRAQPTGPLLINVNIPPGGPWQSRATRLGGRFYTDEVEFRKDPRGREYLWLGGPGVEHRPAAGSDTEAYDAGIIGLTPLVLDLWSRDAAKHAEAVADELQRAAPTP
ncbi:MAG TPA: 5'/3'-nucleotidase SurE [Polyangiaceae bacterium]|nr:5'/3'-nucleotidase SurE [Polyangiaceae bacterium]